MQALGVSTHHAGCEAEKGDKGVNGDGPAYIQRPAQAQNCSLFPAAFAGVTHSNCRTAATIHAANVLIAGAAGQDARQDCPLT